MEALPEEHSSSLGYLGLPTIEVLLLSPFPALSVGSGEEVSRVVLRWAILSALPNLFLIRLANSLGLLKKKGGERETPGPMVLILSMVGCRPLPVMSFSSSLADSLGSSAGGCPSKIDYAGPRDREKGLGFHQAEEERTTQTETHGMGEQNEDLSKKHTLAAHMTSIIIIIIIISSSSSSITITTVSINWIYRSPLLPQVLPFSSALYETLSLTLPYQSSEGAEERYEGGKQAESKHTVVVNAVITTELSLRGHALELEQWLRIREPGYCFWRRLDKEYRRNSQHLYKSTAAANHPHHWVCSEPWTEPASPPEKEPQPPAPNELPHSPPRAPLSSTRAQPAGQITTRLGRVSYAALQSTVLASVTASKEEEEEDGDSIQDKGSAGVVPSYAPLPLRMVYCLSSSLIEGSYLPVASLSVLLLLLDLTSQLLQGGRHLIPQLPVTGLILVEFVELWEIVQDLVEYTLLYYRLPILLRCLRHCLPKVLQFIYGSPLLEMELVSFTSSSSEDEMLAMMSSFEKPSPRGVSLAELLKGQSVKVRISPLEVLMRQTADHSKALPFEAEINSNLTAARSSTGHTVRGMEGMSDDGAGWQVTAACSISGLFGIITDLVVVIVGSEKAEQLTAPLFSVWSSVVQLASAPFEANGYAFHKFGQKVLDYKKNFDQCTIPAVTSCQK
ncbi:hypothetical protein INR49_017539 [Caranx melampygus]|nr:hypothetical protein INR49_017539 [Caranx melampygus]